MLGLILAGGGARGAYEAGVLRFVFGDLPNITGKNPFPKVISGTSVGALTSTWLASKGPSGIFGLSDIWRNLEPHHIYNFDPRDLASLPSRMLGRNTPMAQASALLDPTPLREMLTKRIPWDALYARIGRGDLDALVIAATDVASGRATLFTDGVRSPRPRPTTVVHRTRITPDHCLASAAIPFVFPPVSVEGRYFVDGSLRQNTPLSPAISLGVTRALVVGVKKIRSEEASVSTSMAPSLSFLAGKALNSLMLDPVEEDLRQLRAINGFLEWGQKAYPDFLDRMRQEHRPFRIVKTVFIRPSDDIGRIAADAIRHHADRLPWPTRMLLRAMSGGDNSTEADLMSYLYFDSAFTAEIEQLGYEDARRMETEIATLLADEDEPLS